MLITFDITDDCNGQCTFCCGKGNQYEEIHPMLVPDAFDWITSGILPEYYHNFLITGGEPLIHWDKVKQLIRFIRMCYPKTQVTLNTNGELLTQEIIQFLNHQDIHVTVGIKRESTFGRSEPPLFSRQTIKNTCKLKKRLLNVIIEPDWINDFLTVFFRIRALSKWDFYTILNNERGPDDWDNKQLAKLLHSLTLLLKLYIEKGALSHWNWVDSFRQVAEYLTLPSLETSEYHCDLTGVLISPSGNVYPCYTTRHCSDAKKYLKGNISSKTLKKCPPIMYSQVCKDCHARIICDAVCPIQHHKLGDISGICKVTKAIFETLSDLWLSLSKCMQGRLLDEWKNTKQSGL